jgi:spermidine/putrescine transport system substrate-binding protein
MKRLSYVDLHHQGTAQALGTGTGLTRRRFLEAAGASVLAVSGASGLARPAHAAREVNYIGWDGYQAPEVVGSWENAHDTRIKFTSLTDSGGTFTKLVAGGYRDYDVITNDVPWIQRMGAADICHFLDAATFQETFDSFYPQFAQPFEPLMWDGKITGLPTRWGWVGVNINTKHSKPEDWNSYAPVFDPANRDRIGILDFGDWATFQVILYAGINPFEPLDQNQLDEVRKVFRALFNNTRLITADLVQAQRALLDGSALIFLAGGNYIASGMRKSGNMDIVSFVPEPINGMKQGVIWLEATAVVKDPADPELAEDLLKHLVSTEAGTALAWTEWSACPVPSKSVEALLSEEQKAVIDVANMWTNYDRSLTYTVAPNIDDILRIWQEELTR